MSGRSKHAVFCWLCSFLFLLTFCLNGFAQNQPRAADPGKFTSLLNLLSAAAHPTAHPVLAGVVGTLPEGETRVSIEAHGVAAKLEHGAHLKQATLTIAAAGRVEVERSIRNFSAALLQIAEIDTDNATPEVLVVLGEEKGARVIVAGARSDGPGWDVTPRALSVADIHSGAALSFGNQPAFILKTETLAFSLGLPDDDRCRLLSAFAVHSGAWHRVTGDTTTKITRVALAQHLSRLADRSNWTEIDERAALAVAMVLAGRLGIAREAWYAVRKTDIADQTFRERLVRVLKERGEIDPALSLDARAVSEGGARQ